MSAANRASAHAWRAGSSSSALGRTISFSYWLSGAVSPGERVNVSIVAAPGPTCPAMVLTPPYRDPGDANPGLVARRFRMGAVRPGDDPPIARREHRCGPGRRADVLTRALLHASCSSRRI